MQIKAGSKLRSTADATEVVVVRPSKSPVELTCGGRPMVPAADPVAIEGVLAGHEAEALDPAQGEEAEPVIHLGHVNIRGHEARPLPHRARCVASSHGGHVVELVPRGPSTQSGADRLEMSRRTGGHRGVADGRDEKAVDPSTGASQS